MAFNPGNASVKIKSLTAAALAAASVSAYAVGPGPLGTIDNLPIVIGNTVPAGLLFDVYTFSLVNPGGLSGVVTSVNSPPALGISSFSVVLQNASAAVLGSDLNPADGFSFAGLSAGHTPSRASGAGSGATRSRSTSKRSPAMPRWSPSRAPMDAARQR